MSTVIQFPDRDARPLTKTVSGEVRALMGRHSVNQATLASWLGLHQTAMSKRLRGETEWKVSEIDGIARAFAVHPSELLGGYASGPRPDGGEELPILRARRYSKPQPSDPNVRLRHLSAVA
jgi:hypothetical protein